MKIFIAILIIVFAGCKVQKCGCCFTPHQPAQSRGVVPILDTSEPHNFLPLGLQITSGVLSKAYLDSLVRAGIWYGIPVIDTCNCPQILPITKDGDYVDAEPIHAISLEPPILDDKARDSAIRASIRYDDPVDTCNNGVWIAGPGITLGNDGSIMVASNYPPIDTVCRGWRSPYTLEGFLSKADYDSLMKILKQPPCKVK